MAAAIGFSMLLVAGTAYLAGRTMTQMDLQEIVFTGANDATQADLRAQNDMARAAWAMVLVSIVSVLVGASGVGVVLYTIRQNQDNVLLLANQNKILQRQTRAYLHICGIRYVVTNWEVDIFVTVRNQGQTPAADIIATCTGMADKRLRTVLTPLEKPQVSFPKQVARIPSLQHTNEQELRISLLFPKTDQKPKPGNLTQTLLLMSRGHAPHKFGEWMTLAVDGDIQYQDVYGESHRLSWHGWPNYSKIGNEGAINYSLGG